LAFDFTVNLAKIALISSTSSKVDTYENETEIDDELFFLKLIFSFSKNLINASALQFITVKVSKKFNLLFDFNN
jgi:hypothetical protein